jgi:hypothetical protein
MEPPNWYGSSSVDYQEPSAVVKQRKSAPTGYEGTKFLQDSTMESQWNGFQGSIQQKQSRARGCTLPALWQRDLGRENARRDIRM